MKYYLIMDPDTEEYLVLELNGDAYAEAAKGHDARFGFQLESCV